MAKNTHNNTTSTIERSDDRINVTGEVFTPMELCHKMVSEIPESTLKDPSSTFLDPSAGSGNFLLALQTELLKYHTITHINDNMLFGVELMEDNYMEYLLGNDGTSARYESNDVSDWDDVEDGDWVLD